MNRPTETDSTGRDAPQARAGQRQPLSTADLAAAGEAREARQVRETRDEAPRPSEDRVVPQRQAVERPAAQAQPARQPAAHDDELAALFTPEIAAGFRSRWDAVQIGFVDDPGQAVRHADELVAEVMKSLADSFAQERARFESRMHESQTAATENMRVAVRRYRSFFERLLSL